MLMALIAKSSVSKDTNNTPNTEHHSVNHFQASSFVSFSSSSSSSSAALGVRFTRGFECHQCYLRHNRRWALQRASCSFARLASLHHVGQHLVMLLERIAFSSFSSSSLVVSPDHLWLRMPPMSIASRSAAGPATCQLQLWQACKFAPCWTTFGSAPGADSIDGFALGLHCSTHGGWFV